MSLTTGTIIYPYTTNSNGVPQLIYTTDDIPITTSTLYDENGNALAYSITSVTDSNGNINLNVTISSNNYVYSRVKPSSGKIFTTSSKTITSNGTYNSSSDNADGYSSVTVNTNELKGETKTEELTSYQGNTFTPTSGKNGITSITVTPKNRAITLTPSTSQQEKGVASSYLNGYSGYGKITVNAVTSAIDSNITAGNIKSGVTILGVTGTYEGSGGGGGGGEITTGGSSVKYNYLVRQNQNGTLSFENIIDPETGLAIPADETECGSAFDEYYQDDTSLVNFSMANIEDLGEATFTEAFIGSNIVSADFSSMTFVARDAFQGAFMGTPIKYANFQSLVYATSRWAFESAFEDCTELEAVNFDSLQRVSSSTSYNYSSFVRAFSGCTSLQNLYFPSMTTTYAGDGIFMDMLVGVTGCTVHFPSSCQSVFETLASVIDGFGGTNTTVLFDLPATT